MGLRRPDTQGHPPAPRPGDALPDVPQLVQEIRSHRLLLQHQAGQQEPPLPEALRVLLVERTLQSGEERDRIRVRQAVAVQSQLQVEDSRPVKDSQSGSVQET